MRGACARVADRRLAGRTPDAPERNARLGERRLPARPPGRCRGRRLVRRAVFHVSRGRGFLRGRPSPRRPRAVHAGGGDRARAGQIGRGGARHRVGGLPARPRGVLREAPSALGAAAPHVPSVGAVPRLIVGVTGIMPRCASASTRESCTTSASGPTSATCCGSWRGSTTTRSSSCSAGRAIARTLAALGENFRAGARVGRQLLAGRAAARAARAAARGRDAVPRAALRAAAARLAADRS